jgi:hypothetical protein
MFRRSASRMCTYCNAPKLTESPEALKASGFNMQSFTLVALPTLGVSALACHHAYVSLFHPGQGAGLQWFGTPLGSKM